MNKIKKYFLAENNLSPIQKIALAGLMIALVTILQKVVAINYISVLPFLRVSFGGCALIIFSSILLGPLYGLLIGASSDLLGYFIFDPKTYALYPQITFIYALLGFAPFFIHKLVKFIQSEKVMACVEYGSFFVLFIACTLFITIPESFTLYSTTYHLEIWQKIVIPIILFILFALLILFNNLTARYFKKRNVDHFINVHKISFTCFICEISIMILFGTLMKGWAFGFSTYPVILITQIIVGFINIPLNTFLISYIMLLTRKYFKNV